MSEPVIVIAVHAEPTDSLTLGQARAEFFARSGFDSEGGYNARYVHFQFGAVKVALPNTAARRRAVRFHDLHHILAGYDTSWTGEAEIAAWELGSGCGRYSAAWVLNLLALPLGLVIAPARTWRAFRRGRRSGTLYTEQWTDAWLEESVGAMRSRLELDRLPGTRLPADVLLFAACVAPPIAGLVGVALGLTAAVRVLTGVAG